MDAKLLVEKYRPRTLDDIVNQKDIINRFKTFVITKSLPHLLLVGPSGVGKTCSLFALIHDLYGSNYRNFILYTNGAYERGISFVRDRLLNYAKTAIRSSNHIGFKTIIIEQADLIIPYAQQALRKIMDDYVDICRVCLIANSGIDIIEPIQSRCSLFRYYPIKNKKIEDWLSYISNRENIHIKDEGLNAISEGCEGDLRKAINLLQAASGIDPIINKSLVNKLLGNAYPSKIKKMIDLAVDGCYLGADRILKKLLNEIGIGPRLIIQSIHNHVMLETKFSEETKIKLIDIIGRTDFRIQIGTPEIQLSALLKYISLIVNE